jgi:hypothetical protein
VSAEPRYHRPRADGILRCRPGGTSRPTRCGWHVEHHWCDTCEGWYGVPHDGIHQGPDAHPQTLSKAVGCACRPCRQAVEHSRQAAR